MNKGMGKGIVFTLMSVLIALSLFSLLANYRLFVSELALAKSEDIGIPQAFAYVGSHTQKIADVEMRVTFNTSHTFVNFTDKAFRDSPYNASLKAYRDFLVNHMNLSYVIDFNETVPVRESVFDIEGMNAEYNYSNFTKHNISVLQKQKGEALFVKRYEIFINPLNTACNVDKVVRLGPDTDGNLSIFLVGGSQTLTDSVSRTSATFYQFNFTPTATCPGTVNVTVGRVFDFNSSIRVDPREKVWVNTTVIAKTGELPK